MVARKIPGQRPPCPSPPQKGWLEPCMCSLHKRRICYLIRISFKPYSRPPINIYQSSWQGAGKKIKIVIDLGGNKLYGKNKNCACLLYIHQKQNKFKEDITSLSVILSMLLKKMQLLAFFTMAIKYLFLKIFLSHINYFITYGVCISVKFFSLGITLDIHEHFDLQSLLFLCLSWIVEPKQCI